ncbi:MAG: hypothetical protein EBX37_18935, partial [Alphaproteobacteria bacterium]|nr:hypothetical protein [Alphaproteobacteria bacterium]
LFLLFELLVLLLFLLFELLLLLLFLLLILLLILLLLLLLLLLLHLLLLLNLQRCLHLLFPFPSFPSLDDPLHLSLISLLQNALLIFLCFFFLLLLLLLLLILFVFSEYPYMLSPFLRLYLHIPLFRILIFLRFFLILVFPDLSLPYISHNSRSNLFLPSLLHNIAYTILRFSLLLCTTFPLFHR